MSFAIEGAFVFISEDNPHTFGTETLFSRTLKNRDDLVRLNYLI